MFGSECVFLPRVRSHADGDVANLKYEDRKEDGFADDKLEIYNQSLMFPSECVLERRVRVDDDDDVDDTNLPLFILKCDDRHAEGYADDKLEIYNKMLQAMVIGLRLADAPPALSFLVIRGVEQYTEIAAVDKAVIVIRLHIPDEVVMSYLVFDSVALSLRMFPEPDEAVYALTSRPSIARPCHGLDYALVHKGRLVESCQDNLYLWRPSSSSPPWSEYKKAYLPGFVNTDTELSFNGYAFWVDLLWGVMYCSCNALFDDNSSSVVKFDYLRLPVGPGGLELCIAEPAAYRTMDAVRNSFIRFVSIDGFEDSVKLKDRTITVWKLQDDIVRGWEVEHELTLQTLWGFEGFGNLPKDLTPMYPLLSTTDPDVVYLVLGEHEENQFEKRFFPSMSRYRIAVDMRDKTVRTCLPLEDEDEDVVSCGFSLHLYRFLDGLHQCGGIPMKKKLD